MAKFLTREKTVTILSGQTDSEIIDIGEDRIAAIHFPTSMEGTTATLRTYINRDPGAGSEGTPVQVGGVSVTIEANKAIVVDIMKGIAFDSIGVTTDAMTVADRLLTLKLVPFSAST